MKEINFEYTVSSDVDFEDLVADIGFDTNLVALLTQDQGFEQLRIRLYPPKDKEYWDFPLHEFLKVIEDAKSRLWELRKLPENPEDDVIDTFNPGDVVTVKATAPKRYCPGARGVVHSFLNPDPLLLLELVLLDDGTVHEIPSQYLEKCEPK